MGRSLVQFECEFCHNVSSQTRKDYVRSKSHFCSQDCVTRSRLSKITKPCMFCGASVTRKTSEFKYDTVFCSHSCSTKFHRRKNGATLKHNKTCERCGSSLKEWQKRYCSHHCCLTHKEEQYIQKWKNKEVTGNVKYSLCRAVKKYIWTKYGNKCAECGWDKIHSRTKKSPLEIHHIDGNSDNSYEDNLILLCPNCHSLTPNAKSLNSGNGRYLRRLQDAKHRNIQ